MSSGMMIAGMTLYQICWYFLMYSFFGWCVEVAYHVVTQGKIINRGFLAGPVCPVYGFGMLVVFAVIDIVSGTTVSEIAQAHGVVIFLCGMILASVVEFIGGWALYHAFHARWWDYRDRPFNLGGYVCLQFSIYWGLGALLVIRVLHPVIDHISAGLFPEKLGWPIMAVFYLIYIADFIVTVMIVAGLNKKLAELDKLRADMRIVSDDLSEKIGTQTMESMQVIDKGRVKAALAKAELRDTVEEKKTEAEKEVAKLKAEGQAGVARTQQEVEHLKESAASKIESAKETGKAKAEAVSEANARCRAQTEERMHQLHTALSQGEFFGPRRILKAFPGLTFDSENFDAIMDEVRKDLED